MPYIFFALLAMVTGLIALRLAVTVAADMKRENDWIVFGALLVALACGAAIAFDIGSAIRHYCFHQ